MSAHWLSASKAWYSGATSAGSELFVGRCNLDDFGACSVQLEQVDGEAGIFHPPFENEMWS